jgi:hypothetical protein
MTTTTARQPRSRLKESMTVVLGASPALHRVLSHRRYRSHSGAWLMANPDGSIRSPQPAAQVLAVLRQLKTSKGAKLARITDAQWSRMQGPTAAQIAAAVPV